MLTDSSNTAGRGNALVGCCADERTFVGSKAGAASLELPTAAIATPATANAELPSFSAAFSKGRVSSAVSGPSQSTETIISVSTTMPDPESATTGCPGGTRNALASASISDSGRAKHNIEDFEYET
jgi:hypothetical protein